MIRDNFLSIDYGHTFEKIFHFFFTISKKVCFRWISSENIQSFITFNEVSESVDGLQIEVSPTDTKIKSQ